MTAASGRKSHVVVPLRTCGSPAVTLAFPTGMKQFRITAEPTLSDLLEADLAEPAPRLRVTDQMIELAHPFAAEQQSSGSSAVRLSTQATWALQANEVVHLELDLSATQLLGLTFGALAHASLILPNPVGEVTVALGAASDVVLTRPDTVPVRICVHGVVYQLRLDDRFREAAMPGVDDQTEGWQSARNRYVVLVRGRAEALSVRCADVDHIAARPTSDRLETDD